MLPSPPQPLLHNISVANVVIKEHVLVLHIAIEAGALWKIFGFALEITTSDVHIVCHIVHFGISIQVEGWHKAVCQKRKHNRPFT